MYAKFTYDKIRPYGATYGNTIYWQLVGPGMYWQPWFCPLLKKCMLAVNVYYFFLRRWCLPQCLINLTKTFDGSQSLFKSQPFTRAQAKMGVELLLVSYVAGVCFVPGGHQQFQMWYWELIPIAIEMVGLPTAVTFKLFHDVWPCRIRQPILHHNITLFISFWLMTVGPDVFDRYRKWSKEEEDDEDKKLK